MIGLTVRAREQVLATRAASASGQARQGSVAREGSTQGGHGQEEGTRQLEEGSRESTRPQEEDQGRQGEAEAGVREVARREGSNGEGIGSAAHESSTQRTQEQEEEVAQGEGEEHQSTRVNTAGAGAEQEESGDEETRNEGGMQGRVQDGHAGSSAHERTAPRTPEGRLSARAAYPVHARRAPAGSRCCIIKPPLAVGLGFCRGISVRNRTAPVALIPGAGSRLAVLSNKRSS